MLQFFKNKKTGAIYLEVCGQSAEVDENLEVLVPNSTDAAGEKHVPIVTVENDLVVVRIGSVPHPMTPEHYIEGVFVQTSAGGTYCKLTPEDIPEAKFPISPDEVEAVYIYCNLHGLWKAKEPVLPNSFDMPEMICSAEFTQGCINPLDE